ncbi:hypothetical protein QVD17_14168 [Tagetes erecta]|uniref:Uncharacterized protein n=1 Tax=Tagetes erecta TaxID=13708 RepID=A0AAD8L303_TARER|nr:hypothetical protein QVD17_14168 [Tagetes erecta]
MKVFRSTHNQSSLHYGYALTTACVRRLSPSLSLSDLSHASIALLVRKVLVRFDSWTRGCCCCSSCSKISHVLPLL